LELDSPDLGAGMQQEDPHVGDDEGKMVIKGIRI
jgi:hypothetical protein